ncbi:HEAT repeat domain-containing protein [Candidatus Micrarchaeota archaeon]|nr:HEAT repeat domain-containing protein [Candidatus Micrarchaeota archaeon]
MVFLNARRRREKIHQARVREITKELESAKSEQSKANALLKLSPIAGMDEVDYFLDALKSRSPTAVLAASDSLMAVMEKLEKKNFGPYDKEDFFNQVGNGLMDSLESGELKYPHRTMLALKSLWHPKGRGFHVVRMISHANPALRIIAAAHAPTLKPLFSQSIPKLVERLGDENEKVAQTAGGALLEIGGKNVKRRLLAASRQKTGAAARHQARQLLALIEKRKNNS